MFDTIAGLPVHALVVHAVVVLVPLAALGAVAIALVPRWRGRYGPLVLAVATAGLVMVPVAVQSGQELEARIQAGGVVAEQIKDHRELGELVIWPTLAMWLLTAALVVASRRRRGGRGGRGATALAVVVVIAAVAAGTVVSLAGHRGSTAVWSCTIGSDACK